MAAGPQTVSLWRDRGKQGFLCSGLRLDAKHILTVKHAFTKIAGDGPVYVRLIDGVDGDVKAKIVQRHREHDAAILALETAAGNPPQPRLLTQSTHSYDGKAATLHVIDPDSKDRATPTGYGVSSFDHETGEFVLNPENASGHSGGVVEVEGWIIALLSRRTPDDPICRAVGMHLLWDWISASLRGTVPTAADADTEASSAGPVSAAYRELVHMVRERVQRQLASPLLDPLARQWGPDPLADFDLRDPGAALTERLDALYRVTKDCAPALRASRDQVAAVKEQCRLLYGELTKLALDPDGVGQSDRLRQLAGSPAELLQVVCQDPEIADAAYTARRDLPSPFRLDPATGALDSAHGVYFRDDIAGGVGEDQRQELLRKLSVRVIGRPEPVRVEPEQEQRLVAAINRHRRRGQGEYRVIAGRPAGELRSIPLADWTGTLGIALVLYQEGDCPFLFGDEWDVIDGLREYLELLEREIR